MQSHWPQMVSTVSDMLTSVIDKGITTDEDRTSGVFTVAGKLRDRVCWSVWFLQVVDFVGTMVNLPHAKIVYESSLSPRAGDCLLEGLSISATSHQMQLKTRGCYAEMRERLQLVQLPKHAPLPRHAEETETVRCPRSFERGVGV